MRGDLRGLVEEIVNQQPAVFTPASYSFDLLDYPSLYESQPGTAVGSLYGPEAMGDTAYSNLAAFYENLAAALFGCTHKRSKVVASDGAVGYPDILHVRRSQGIESKGVQEGRALDLRDNQIDYLGHFQRAHPGYRVSFAVSRYFEPTIKLPEMTQDELVRFLASDATAYMVVFPLSVAHELHAQGAQKTGVSYRYNGGKQWLPRTRVNSTVLDKLAVDPVATLQKIGHNSDDYRVSISKSSSRMTCHGQRIKSFPIVRIRDLKHREWVKSFTRNYSSVTDDGDQYERLERVALTSPEPDEVLVAADGIPI